MKKLKRTILRLAYWITGVPANAPHPIELITTDDLLTELKARHDSWVIVLVKRTHKSNEGLHANVRKIAGFRVDETVMITESCHEAIEEVFVQAATGQQTKEYPGEK